MLISLHKYTKKRYINIFDLYIYEVLDKIRQGATNNMKKNHKFFQGKNSTAKNQEVSKKFFNGENKNNNSQIPVSFVNARRNTRNFNEQSSSNFVPSKIPVVKSQNNNTNKNNNSGFNNKSINDSNNNNTSNKNGNTGGQLFFINARKNTRSFREQINSDFGTGSGSPEKHHHPNVSNKHHHNQNHNNFGNKNQVHHNQKNFVNGFNNSNQGKGHNSNQNKNNSNQNNKSYNYSNTDYPNTNGLNVNNKPTNIELDKYIKALNFSDQSQLLLAICDQFQKIDLQKLHALDEKLLEEAIVSSNREIVELTVIAYVYRKLISKKHIFNSPNWKKFKDKTVTDLKLASELSKKLDHTEYNKKIKEIQTDIENTDKLLGHFIHDITFNARVKLASSAYAYGLSLSQASNLLSADKDLVMELLGQTKIPDEDTRSNNKSITDKVELLKKMVVIRK